MRVLVLSHYFWPEPIPKPLELAQALRDEGHSPVAVTGFPNYPDGRLYPGFSLRWLAREEVHGIPVIRTFMYPSHSTGLAGRLANYASFMVSSVAGGLAAGAFDVMYVWHPPLTIGVAAAAIGLLRRRPFVYDVQDIWPESAIATGFLRPGLVVKALAVLERWVYRRARHIFVVTEGARQNLLAKGVPLEKVTVAPHWYDDTPLRSVETQTRSERRRELGSDDRFVIMFAGNMGLLQGLDTVVRACALLPRGAGIQVLMVGDGVDLPRLRQLADASDVNDRIRFVPRQSPSEIARFYAAADALLVHLRASPLAPLTLPSKTVAYLAAGRPIIMAGIGASADIIAESGAGIVVPPDDPAALAAGMVNLSQRSEAERTTLGEQGRGYFDRHFSRAAVLPLYLQTLERAAGRGALRTPAS